MLSADFPDDDDDREDDSEDDDDDRRQGSMGLMKPLNGGESRCDGLTPPPPNATPTKLMDIVCHQKTTNSTSKMCSRFGFREQILL